MRTRGFTLLEILVALSVLVVVLALSLPALTGRLERGSFRANADQLAGALRRARSEARAAGEPVSVRARPLASGENVIEWAFASGGEPDSQQDVTQTNADSLVWTPLAELVRSVTLTDQDPDQMLDDDPGAEGLLFEAGVMGAEDEGVRTLCVFLPGAEAIVPGAVWLLDAEAQDVGDARRWVKVTVSPWTGRVRSEAGSRSSPESVNEDMEEASGLLAPSGARDEPPAGRAP